MDEQSLNTIRMEVAVLYRRIAAFTVYRKTLGHLEHSAVLLLEHIATRGPAGVKKLADDFLLNMSTISRQAASLEKKGYVYRIPDPHDGRAYSLQITDLGLKELEEVKHIGSIKLNEILNTWSDDELEKFGELLKKFNNSIQDSI